MPSDRKTVLPIVTQCADYARLHLSASPFQLFSIGLMIFGFEFCVAIFDRDGIMFSPIRDMLKDKGVFIRVVRRLTCDLSPVELGQDPTVRMIGDVESIPWKEKAKAVAGTDKFPCFSITMGGNDHRQWFTLGPPIWTSISLLGRGTSIWRVCEATDPADVTQPVLVLKNAWRSSKRTAESDIYKSITDSHPGVASHYFGTDVMFPGIDNHTINVNNLRGDAPCDDEGTPILHRLLLKTIGRPLWEYSSDLEFLKGLRAALRGKCDCLPYAMACSTSHTYYWKVINIYANEAFFIEMLVPAISCSQQIPNLVKGMKDF